MLTKIIAISAPLPLIFCSERCCIPPLFRPYVHTELFASFDQLRRYILRMVTESAIETYVRVPFRLEGGIFKLDLKASWRGSTFILAAHPKPSVTQNDLRGWIESALIGTESLQPSLRLRRVLGARRQEVERIPEVVVARGTLLYEIVLDDECAIFDEQLWVENPLRERSDHAPAELSMYVKIEV